MKHCLMSTTQYKVAQKICNNKKKNIKFLMKNQIHLNKFKYKKIIRLKKRDLKNKI